MYNVILFYHIVLLLFVYHYTAFPFYSVNVAAAIDILYKRCIHH